VADLRERLEHLTGAFSERPAQATGTRRPRTRVAALEQGYWEGLRELFTRDLTRRQLVELVQQDARETLRFFTRDLDLARLERAPWHERYPRTAWAVFLALAHRLSPPRRVLFALAVLVLALAWLGEILGLGGGAASRPGWALVAGTLLLFVLLLELHDKLLLKSDLEVARQIQFGLLPFEPLRRGTLGVDAAMRPANTVGGDYFDAIDLDDGRLAVVIGDVAGKGMPAALLMALLQGSLRTLLTAGLRGSALLRALNSHLHADIPANRLVTLFYLEADAVAGAFHYVNAGHNPPVLQRANGRLERLAPTGVALGVLPDAEFEVAEAALGPGDRLLLYTDGVTEAFDPRDVEYGEARLEALLRARADLAAPELLAAVEADVLAHCAGRRPHDDMTLLLLSARAGDR
jgi:hypothetical protein